MYYQEKRQKKNMVFWSSANSQAGFSLIYMVVALTVLSALAAGVMGLTTSSNYSEVADRYAIQARYAAISGLNYISGWNENYFDLEEKTIQLTDDSGNVVSLIRFLDVKEGQEPPYINTAEILGIAAPGTPHESRYKLHARFFGADANYVGFLEEGTTNDDDNSTDLKDFDDFEVVVSDPNKEPIVKDYEKGRFTIGANQNSAFAAMTYAGNATMNFGENNCTEGECQFRYGLRAFMTVWYNKNDADGLVLTFFNGENNDWDSVGGHSTHGELIGYAGDSRYQDGGWKFLDPEMNGIQPPKIGFEIDNWGNYHPKICNDISDGNRWTTDYDYPFNAMTGGPNSGSRFDPGGHGVNGVDHLAVDLWGLDQKYMCAYREFAATTAEGAQTFDDNTHGFTSHMMDPMLAYTEDKYPGGATNYVRMYNGGVTRVGQAFRLEDLTGMRDPRLDTNQRVIAASFYVRPHGHPTGTMHAKLYNSDGGVLGATALPAGEVNNDFTSRGVATDMVFFDSNLHSDYEDTTEWRLVTFYFNADHSDFKYSPKQDLNSPYKTLADIYPSDMVVAPNHNYVIVLEYDDGSSYNAVDVAVDKSSSWPGNYVQYDESTHNWSADGTWTPIYYVHLYEQIFRFMDNVPYFDEAPPAGGGFDNYELYHHRNALRIEIDRAQNATAFGDEMRYKYNIRAWVRRCSDETIEEDCPDYVGTFFSDTRRDLNATKNPPAIDTDIFLTQAQHDAYDRVLIGFTEATGGSTQIATFGHFIVRFKRPNDSTINEVAYPGNR
ncbi:type IV pilus modification PilV family protein [Oceanidesulfovibrio marinus]|uniref:Type II secretion system protein n=1 Tax=Oceanidesulfovibrio marinus TaxID=370038 RepID=A0ABX6NER3_9BACT|nr:type II secretion system protein [Oceanidesulfovibrio marinus]QJT09106.1 type II secretion system protein [Oceanidesulfovibrio marinus]